MNPANKQYGLLIPKKKQSTFKATNVFGDDSDEETPKQEINASLQKSSLQAKIKRQTQIEIDKALEADPTVYEYDNIYDDLKAKKEEKDAALQQKKDKKPKYIAGLLKAAEIRKKEDERRAEKKIQKEREKEGNEFEDKEVFVTGAYKKKMQEIQEQEEKERREAAMEEMLDVKKQRDLSGFYRYMLNEQSAEPVKEEHRETTKVKVKEEPDSPKQSESKEGGRSSRDKSPQDSRNRGGRSSSHDRGRRRKNSSSDSEDKNRRGRESPESSERHRKNTHSPTSHRHRRKDSPKSDRDRQRTSYRERDSRKDRMGDSDSEGSDRDSKKKSEKRSEDSEHSEKQWNPDRKRSAERDSVKESEKKAKVSDVSEESKDNKKSGVVAKKTTDSVANEARRRYLERKLAKEKAKLMNQQE